MKIVDLFNGFVFDDVAEFGNFDVVHFDLAADLFVWIEVYFSDCNCLFG